jgi:predicted nucleotidyltransferase
MAIEKPVRSGIAEIREKIMPFCEQHPEIAAVFLFGSYGTCYQTRFSDLDMGMLFFPDTVPDLRGEMDLTGLLCAAAGQDNVDMGVMNKAPLPLRYRIVSEGELIYEKDDGYTSDFLAATYQLFLDYNIDYRVFMDEYGRSLKEAYKNNG